MLANELPAANYPGLVKHSERMERSAQFLKYPPDGPGVPGPGVGNDWHEELHSLAKVPAVTAGFWVIKILATTLGETGGDAVSMSMGLGYLVGTAIFMVLFVGTVALQIASGDSTRCCTGPPSSHRPPSARPWRISLTVRWA